MTDDVFFEKTADSALLPVLNMTYLEETGDNRHEYTGADKDNETDLDPDEGVNGVINLCY